MGTSVPPPTESQPPSPELGPAPDCPRGPVGSHLTASFFLHFSLPGLLAAFTACPPKNRALKRAGGGARLAWGVTRPPAVVPEGTPWVSRPGELPCSVGCLPPRLQPSQLCENMPALEGAPAGGQWLSLRDNKRRVLAWGSSGPLGRAEGSCPVSAPTAPRNGRRATPFTAPGKPALTVPGLSSSHSEPGGQSERQNEVGSKP